MDGLTALEDKRFAQAVEKPMGILVPVDPHPESAA